MYSYLAWTHTMKDRDRPKRKLIRELSSLRQKLDELSNASASHAKSEEWISKSDKKYQILFEAAGDSIFIVRMGEDGPRFVDMNSRTLEMFKCTREEMINKTPADISPQVQPDGRSSVEGIQKWSGAAMEGRPQFFEWTHSRMDGTTFPAEVTLNRIDIGSEVYIQAIVRDITDRKMTEQILKESEERYRILVENQNDLIVKLDADFDIVFVNPNFCRIFGKNEEQLIGSPFTPLVSRDESTRLKNALGSVLINQPHTTYYEEKAETIEGWKWFGWSVKGVVDDHDCLKEIIAVGRDISHLKDTEKALKKSHKLLINVLDGIEAIVYVADIHTYEVLYVNKYTRNIFGDLDGKTCWQTLQSGQFAPCSFCTNDKLITPEGRPAGVYHWEYQNTLDGKWYDIRDIAIEWLDGRIVKLAIATDISELKESEELLRSMSFIDDLTGLHNRRGFLTLASQQLRLAHREKRGMLILFADLDNMKWINDNMGHLAGDRALKDFARIMRLTFRESDIIARIGGDEFAVLAMETPDIDIDCIAARLQSSLHEYNSGEDRICELSVSLGTVRFDPDRPHPIEELLSEADSLMYRHKKTKKQRYS